MSLSASLSVSSTLCSFTHLSPYEVTLHDGSGHRYSGAFVLTIRKGWQQQLSRRPDVQLPLSRMMLGGLLLCFIVQPLTGIILGYISQLCVCAVYFFRDTELSRWHMRHNIIQGPRDTCLQVWRPLYNSTCR